MREELLAIPGRLRKNSGLASAFVAFRRGAGQKSRFQRQAVDATGSDVSVVAVAQSVRVPDCDSGGRGFESPQPPH